MLAWDAIDGVELLRWEGPRGVVAAFSCRRGGVSTGPFDSLNLGVRSGDDVPRVLENRARLCAAVGADPARTSACWQRHSAVVHRAGALAPADGFTTGTAASPDGDGLVADEAGRAVVAFAADCVPIVLARADGSAVAAVHAGWRGLLAGVVPAAVQALGVGQVVAAVGPCAGPRRYEVGEEVATPFRARFGDDVVRGRLLDLPAAAGRALAGAGVEDVDVAGICTIEDARFFSHRRDGAPGGRQCAIAYLARAA